jgi:hypothetical protein
MTCNAELNKFCKQDFLLIFQKSISFLDFFISFAFAGNYWVVRGNFKCFKWEVFGGGKLEGCFCEGLGSFSKYFTLFWALYAHLRHNKLQIFTRILLNMEKTNEWRTHYNCLPLVLVLVTAHKRP